jgi:hypothetical protein
METTQEFCLFNLRRLENLNSALQLIRIYSLTFFRLLILPTEAESVFTTQTHTHTSKICLATDNPVGACNHGIEPCAGSALHCPSDSVRRKLGPASVGILTSPRTSFQKIMTKALICAAALNCCLTEKFFRPTTVGLSLDTHTHTHTHMNARKVTKTYSRWLQ